VNENETTRERFVRLAESRTNRALDAIRTLGNLSNRRVYAWEEQDIRRVSKALRDAISEMEASFTTTRGRAENRFRLSREG
jgi:hypothetical protein